uniref:Uncharacterized protein n=1 Tax=Arundo donax TaxID=35708 RepID=A0A0A8Y3S4_ARUDO
MQNVIESMPL